MQSGKGKRILDIGCGTGYVADTLAMQYPDAELFGVDLSNVPYRPGRPSNVHFLQGNVMNQPPSTWRRQEGGESLFPDEDVFDLLFSRFLIAGITDWPAFIETEFHLLKKDGWAEIHELDPIVYNAAGEPTNNKAYWHTIPEQASAEEGIEYLCARKMEPRMREAGFVDIKVADYPLPLGGEGEKTPELQAAGDFFHPTMTHIRDLMIRRYVKQSQEEEDRMITDMRKGMAPEPGKHYKIVVTYGRKP